MYSIHYWLHKYFFYFFFIYSPSKLKILVYMHMQCQLNTSFFLLLLYFFHRILLLTFILTILYRTNIIHRDKQLYWFPSHRFSFLPVDSNDGFVGLALLLGFLIEKVDHIEIGDGPAFFTFLSFFDREIFYFSFFFFFVD